ncbi:MAG: DVU0150 family protein [Acidobacteriota bacterium]
MTPCSLRAQLTLWVSCVLVSLHPALLEAAPAEKAGKLVHVADTRNLSGFNLFVANLYNTDRLLFTIFAVGLTAILGLFLGWVMDVAVSAIGLDLEKRHSRE